MTQLYNFNTTLSQLLDNVRAILSNSSHGNQLAVQQQQTQGKQQANQRGQAAEQTYLGFLKAELKKAGPLTEQTKGASYKLQEDLTLLLEIESLDKVTVKSFEQIATSKKIHRTGQSLRSRYYEHLAKLTEVNMKQIVRWLKTEGIEGYLTMDNDMLIQKNDPKEKASDRKRPRGPNMDTDAKVQDKKPQKIKSMPSNCKELHQVLKLYSKMVNMPIVTLLEKLDQMSGDFMQLDTYIETKDEHLLWTPEEDDMLRKGGAEIEILSRFRGKGVQSRRQYLGLA